MERKFYKENVVYQIYPRSFSDSNGDGIGDIPGIISKLDYLKELGVGIIWLSPVYPSPLDDLGYDVASYYDIHPDYGTMEDMEKLIKEANNRGIKIVMDLVVNHTSDEHEWFKKSKDVNSPYHKYYYWEKGRKRGTKPPNNWDSIFSGSAWKYDKEVGKWYLHLYSEKQPDLNYHNEAVIEEVEKILKFWLDKGIYGFRCDVINQIYKTSLKNGRKRLHATGKEHYFNQEGNHKILRRFYENVFSKYDCFTIGETFDASIEDMKKFLDNELTMCFSFEHVNVDKLGLPIFKKKYKPSAMKNCLRKWQENIEWNTLYFENHDQHRSIGRFGDVSKYYFESATMLGTILFTLKGTPFIFEGQEIGMINNKYSSLKEVNDVSAHRVYRTLKKMVPFLGDKKIFKMVDLNNRDHSRTPIPWNDEEVGGFSKVKPWIKEAPFYKEINVKKNLEDSNSIFHFYQKLIKVRKDNLPLVYGSIRFLGSNKNIFAFYRELENEKSIFVTINLSNKTIKNKFYEQGEILVSNYKRESFSNLKYLKPYEVVVVKTLHE